MSPGLHTGDSHVACATLKLKLGKEGLSACVGECGGGGVVVVKRARVSAGRDG